MGNIRGEVTHVVVLPGHTDGDGQFCVVLAHHHLSGTKQFELQAAPQTRLVDVGQQSRHLSPPWKLLFKLRHKNLRLLPLFFEIFEVHGFGQLELIVLA